MEEIISHDQQYLICMCPYTIISAPLGIVLPSSPLYPMPFEIPLIITDKNSGGQSYGALLKRVHDFFQQQHNYTSKKDKINYYNDITGVYFTLYLPTDKYLLALENSRDLLPPSHSACLLLSISVGRSTAFILEAIREMDKVCEYFSISVYDCNENATWEYDRDTLLEEWCIMNRTLCKIIQTHEYTKYWTLPGKVIETCWNWNYEIKEKEMTGLLPLPCKIYYAPKKHVLNLSTFVVWKIASNTVLPTFVDYVVVAVDGFDHKTVVLFQIKMVQLLQVLAELKLYQPHSEQHSYKLELTHSTPPEQLMRFVLKQKIIAHKYQFVKEEQILDEDHLL